MEQLFLGIELGSTRIKAVLTDENHKCIATGAYAWENAWENGVWTYDMRKALEGIRVCYSQVNAAVQAKIGKPLTTLSGLGVSGMMHGYLVYDKEGDLLVPFRTWRNTITGQATKILNPLLQFNIPQRWSIAHLYQAILNNEAHLPNIARLTTLACQIHFLLTGEHAVGVGEASGMFPYDDAICDYDKKRMAAFDSLIAPLGLPWKLRDILPRVCRAGEIAGYLTAEGAALLDESGNLLPGIPVCPPEGDAGTGMVSTNAILPRTGSISAGTSGFTMQVLEKPMEGFYDQVDVVATPAGKTVAMIHANTCSSELDTWVRLIADGIRATGAEPDMNALYPALFRKALEGDPDCGGLVSYNFVASEPMVGIEDGRPMTVRTPDSQVNMANFMRSQLYSAVATLRLGLSMLREKEHVETDTFLGQGGYFKTPGVGQQILADALKAPITTMETAGEGGPWGMALLATYMVRREAGETLEDYLANKVFADAVCSTLQPTEEGAKGYDVWLSRYEAGLEAAKLAAKIQ